MSTSCTGAPAATDTVPTRPGHMLRRVLATVALSCALTAGGAALPATASAAEMPAGVGATRLLPAWCPFGTHSGPGGGCRGGSINDNSRANAAARDTAELYRDAGECAARAVGRSLVRNWKRPTLGTIAGGTVKPALKCGRSKGH